jgi:nucleoid DNA-binding protein
MNKGDIVKKLREQGLSRRSAVRIFNQIFAEMAAALSRGEAVEFPFGSLKRIHHGRKEQRGRFLGEMRSIYTKLFTLILEVNSYGEKLLQKRTTRRQDLLAELWRRRPASASNRRRIQP